MVVLHDEDEPHWDSSTIQMQLQQFFDEWHYRILHSGLAIDYDREKVVELLLDIFEFEGMEVTPEEKQALAQMEDEGQMIAEMVEHLPMKARKCFEHFVLQLQLVVSTTTQVRHALEEGNAPAVAQCFEGGDSGPGQQILKHCIIEAGKQIHEAMEMHKSWKASTDMRIARLIRSQDDAEHARQQFEAIDCQLRAFKGEQSGKSKAVLVGMADKNDKTLMHTCFSSWLGWLIRHQLDKDIHDMFKKEITDAEDALAAFKMKQLHISRGMLTRGAASGDQALMAEVIRYWGKYVLDEGHSKDMEKRLEEAQSRLANAKQSAKDASHGVMARMCAGNDKTLLDLCIQSWQASLDELKKDKEIDALAKKAEQQYKDFMNKKSQEARGVLDRMSSGSDSGLLHVMLSNWLEAVKESKREREMEDLVQGNNERFKHLNLKQKGAAKSVASRANQLEEENILGTFFHEWCTETRVESLKKHYSGKLTNKNQKLDAVKDMFKEFANKLDEGIGNTPRTQRKSAGRSKASGDGSTASGGAPVPVDPA
jgi:hypothetical protein